MYDFVKDPVRMHAGDSAPRSGVYRVIHQRHRMPHMVMILEGETLPACRSCGDRVEFLPFMHAASPASDPDLDPPKKVNAKAKPAKRGGSR